MLTDTWNNEASKALDGDGKKIKNSDVRFYSVLLKMKPSFEAQM